ncbi:GNAT family N-acetyltransferase [Thermoleophilia bacterium SCSIO 60948]|nr:GNAT family N-acetyltransferase [Thermoleophilia bacterium SCSIO 60948]
MSFALGDGSRSRLRGELPVRAVVVGTALGAAALTFALHHLPPLAGHALEAIALALGIVGLSAMIAARLWATPSAAVEDVVVIEATATNSLRCATPADVDFMARLHAETLPQAFFVSLGQKFMRRYYATFIESPYAEALVAAVSDHRAGMIVGVLDPPLHVRWIARNRAIALALSALSALVVRPAAASMFLRTRARRYAGAWRRHRRSRSAQAPATDGAIRPAVLSHVSVPSGARHRGIGQSLVCGFETSAWSYGADWITLTTLAGSDGASDFYESLGWRYRGPVHTFDGTRVVEWSIARSAR